MIRMLKVNLNVLCEYNLFPFSPEMQVLYIAPTQIDFFPRMNISKNIIRINKSIIFSFNFNALLTQKMHSRRFLEHRLRPIICCLPHERFNEYLDSVICPLCHIVLPCWIYFLLMDGCGKSRNF